MRRIVFIHFLLVASAVADHMLCPNVFDLTRQHKHLGNQLPATDAWKIFRSGWRFFKTHASEAYGVEYRRWVDKAKTAESFDDFMDALEKGSKLATAASGKDEIEMYGLRHGVRGLAVNFYPGSVPRETWHDLIGLVKSEVETEAHELRRTIKVDLVEGPVDALEITGQVEGGEITHIYVKYLFGEENIPRLFDKLRTLYKGRRFIFS